MGKFITSRFKSACAETGKTIQPGENIYLTVRPIRMNRKSTKIESKRAKFSRVLQARKTVYKNRAYFSPFTKFKFSVVITTRLKLSLYYGPKNMLY